jgi:hypothetical protein
MNHVFTQSRTTLGSAVTVRGGTPTAMQLHGATSIPVRIDDEWLDLTLQQLTEPVWRNKQLYVVTWNGTSFKISTASHPHISSNPKTAVKLSLANEQKIICGPSTKIAVVSNKFDARLDLHPAVANFRSSTSENLKTGDKLLSPKDHGHFLPRDALEIIGKNKQFTVDIDKIRVAKIKEDEYWPAYSMRVHDYENLLLSGGIVVRTN